MAPTEEAILRNYLIIPSQLPAIISLESFTALFPKSLQSSPHIRSLYRDLQAQRNAVVDSVSSNIDAEVKRSTALRRAVLKARRTAEAQEADQEIEIERALGGPPSNRHGRKHTLTSVLPELETAANDLEADMQQLEEEETVFLQEVKQTVGGLSDLRYGRFSNGRLREQVLEGLTNLEETCKRKVN